VLDSRVRRTILLAAIVVIAATMTTNPAAPVSSATYYTRAASCHGFNFFPNTSAINYTWASAARVATSVETSLFVCDPNLPHKAIVTKVQFTLQDGSSAGNLQNCALVRSSLVPTSAGGFEVMASVPATSYLLAPGNIRLTTSTISYATVDLANHAYYVQCEVFILGGPNSQVGIFGADIIYKITAGNG
jgi:hypothetical protein